MNGDDVLGFLLTKARASTWESVQVPIDRCEAMPVPIYKKGDWSICENCTCISL